MAILLGATLEAADSIPEKSASFEIKIEGVVDQELGPVKQNLITSTEFRYSWQRRGRECTLSVDEARTKVSMDGKEIMNAFLSREKFVYSQNGQIQEIPIEMAPDKLKEVLQTYGAPLCRLEVDDNGKELKRTIVAAGAAEIMIKNGAITNGCMFHPPYPPNDNEWSTKGEMVVGTNGLVTGTLNYKKAPTADAPHEVVVSGTLTNDAFMQPGTNIEHKNIRYVVEGKQVFDAAQQEWISGERTAKSTYRIFADGESVGTGAGTLKITFRKLPAKAKAL